MNDLERIETLGIWRGEIDVAPLAGGLSNKSYTVRDRSGAYVARFGEDYPFHHVSRAYEAMTARAAHAAGFAPEVVHSEPGVMVSRFIDGRALSAEEVRADLPAIAGLLRAYHDKMAKQVTGPARLFWVFHVIAEYARLLRAEGVDPARLDRWLSLSAKLEDAQPLMPICFGHHDLLPANILDDGDRLWLIDFEYAGFGTATFDLAGATSNASCDEDETIAFVDAYFGRAPCSGGKKGIAAMQCASLLREGMWALVSARRLTTPGIDFNAYADENFVALDAALDRYQSRYGSLS